MTEVGKEEPLTGRNHPVRWSPEEWKKIEDAAHAWGEREHVNFTPTDVIRSGTMRRCEDLMVSPAADAQG